MKLWLRVALTFGSSIAYLLLAVLGIGGFSAFFSHASLIALAAVILIAAGVGLRAGGNINPGVREERENRWVLIPFALIGLLSGFVPPLCDRLNILTIDGESIRRLGVVVVAIGCWLRIQPVFELGNRFSGLVAIQKDHTLVTTGLYAHIRNPSYLGLLITLVGWSLSFRSGIGLLLTALIIPPLIARINAEEKLLHETFGQEYETYRAHTARLIPRIY